MHELRSTLASLGIVDFKTFLELLGNIGALILFLFAVLKYRESQKWKRSEFLAKEMKEFYSDPLVKEALKLIDWDSLTLKLIQGQDRVTVTRQMQAMALRPHALLAHSDSSTAGSPGDYGSLNRWFDDPEVAIRGSYDAFLDGLARFENYVKSGLISTDEVEVYINYWVARITATANEDDAPWRAALLTYISVYEFKDVLSLFDALECSIRPGSGRYLSYLKSMRDQDFAKSLAATVKLEYPKGK